jgi:hypothetical protein
LGENFPRDFPQNFTRKKMYEKLATVRIHKPVVTYDTGKSSVTNSAGLRNFFLNRYILQF